MDQEVRQRRLAFVDSLRIIGISLIVLQHIITSSPIGYKLSSIYFIYNFFNIQIFYYGSIGVILFIFASGCSLAFNYESFDTLDKVKQFYKKRVLRLYPAYWMTLVLALIVFNERIPFLKPLDYVELASGFQAFVNDFNGYGFFWFWFMGVIVALYLLFPLVAIMIRKRPHISILSLLAISVVSRVIMSQTTWIYRGIDWFPLCRIFEFGLGIYVIQRGFYFKTASNSIVAFLGSISFYLYLTHVLTLSLLQYSILFYAVTVVVLTGMVYSFDNNIKHLTSEKIKKWFASIKKTVSSMFALLKKAITWILAPG